MPWRSSHSRGTKAIKTRKANGDTGQAAKSNSPLSTDSKRGDNFFKTEQWVYYRL
jgi:hypothetical protein